MKTRDKAEDYAIEQLLGNEKELVDVVGSATTPPPVAAPQEVQLIEEVDSKVVNLLKDIEFDKSDITKHLAADRPLLESFVGLHAFSLTYLVKQIFRQPNGRPLELLPFQSVLLDMLWSYKYPMVLASRGAGKTFIYALYAILRALLIPGQQIVIVGAGFRQAKLVFNYIIKLYQSSPLIQEALQGGGGPKMAVDQASINVGSSNIYAIPLGDGERIRGLRATCILCDEFASIPEDIYEIVVQPFAAVHADPARRARIVALRKRLEQFGAPEHFLNMITKTLGFGNQICISGTASFEFNHFYRKYIMYKRIIESNGDFKKMREAFLEGNTYIAEDTVDEQLLASFKYTDYAIFQLPYFGVPEGFMDESVIANAKLTLDPSRFGMEYLVTFAKDSDGFFKRSLLEDATPKGEFKVNLELYGERGAQYVMGIDPARHNDNFAIVILKLTNRGYELVYCWSLNKKDWPVATQKVRELIRRFNIVYIAMDQGGGGASVLDLLHAPEFMGAGDEPIWAMDDDNTKFHPGKHIVDMFQWNNNWVRDANYSMQTELRNKGLLLPYAADEEAAMGQYATFHKTAFKDISESQKSWIFAELYGESNEDGDKTSMGIWDNVIELQNEVCAIVRKVNENGTETFILPPLSQQEKSGKLIDVRRRDRYSALLLASYAARMVRGTGYEKRALPGGTDRQFRSHPGGIVRRGNICFPST
jgi:hypothetical protein